MYCRYFSIISPWKRIVQTWVPYIPKWFVSSLVAMAPWFRKRIIVDVFSLFRMDPSWKGAWPSFKPLSLSPKNDFCHVWLKLAPVVLEKKIGKCLQTYRQTGDRRSVKPTWAFSSDELRIIHQETGCSWLNKSIM